MTIQPVTQPGTTELPISPARASQILGVARQTLANWRHEMKGPPYRKPHRNITYLESEVLAWRERGKVEPRRNAL